MHHVPDSLPETHERPEPVVVGMDLRMALIARGAFAVLRRSGVLLDHARKVARGEV